MLFQFNFYSALLLISFSQGMIFSLLHLIKGLRSGQRAHYWLSLFLLLCCGYIAPWMLGFAGWYDNQPYRNWLFYMPLQHLYWIGPTIYFYTQSLLNPSFRFDAKAALHLLPGVLYALGIFGMWAYDHWVVQQVYFYADGADKDFDSWYQYSGLLSMIIYLVLSIRYYNTYRKLIIQVVSYADSVLFQWVKTYLIAFCIMLLLPLGFEILGYIVPEVKSYTGSWWYFLSFSAVMYYIAVAGYQQQLTSPIAYQWTARHNPVLLLGPHTPAQTPEQTIDIEFTPDDTPLSAEVERWKSDIAQLIETQQLYQKQTLSITDIAQQLHTTVAVISRAINQGFQMNFNDYINSYRIQAVQQLLQQGAHHQTTLLGIAYDCGFNSKATFNRAFKKHTGVSPKAYLNNLPETFLEDENGSK